MYSKLSVPTLMFYEIAIISTPNIFTYVSSFPLKKGDVVKVPVKSKIKKGLVLKEVEKPEFECKEVLDKVGEFSSAQMDLMEFMSKYYFSSIGESASNFFEVKSGK